MKKNLFAFLIIALFSLAYPAFADSYTYDLTFTNNNSNWEYDLALPIGLGNFTCGDAGYSDLRIYNDSAHLIPLTFDINTTHGKVYVYYKYIPNGASYTLHGICNTGNNTPADIDLIKLKKEMDDSNECTFWNATGGTCQMSVHSGVTQMIFDDSLNYGSLRMFMTQFDFNKMINGFYGEMGIGSSITNPGDYYTLFGFTSGTFGSVNDTANNCFKDGDGGMCVVYPGLLDIINRPTNNDTFHEYGWFRNSTNQSWYFNDTNIYSRSAPSGFTNSEAYIGIDGQAPGTNNPKIDYLYIWTRVMHKWHSVPAVITEYAPATFPFGTAYFNITKSIVTNTNQTINMSNLSNTINYVFISVDVNKTADNISNEVGTLNSGNLLSISSDDNNYYNISETTGTPGYLIYINFSGITQSWNQLLFGGYYQGSGAHVVRLQIYNYTSSIWEPQLALVSGTGDANYIINTTGYTDLTLSGKVRVRVNHVSAGNSSHTLLIDKIMVYSESILQNTTSPLYTTQFINSDILHYYGYGENLGKRSNNTDYYTIRFDNSLPVITFTTLNGTIFDKTSSSIMTLESICTDDGGIFTMSSNLTSLGVSYDNFTFKNNTYNPSQYTITRNINISGFATGDYIFSIFCADYHTKGNIKDIPYFMDEKTREITFFPSDNIISIQPSDLSDDIIKTEITKEYDRYSFIFTYDDTLKNSLNRYSYIITSKNELFYFPASPYRGHFVTGNNWIDFEDKDKTILSSKVTKVKENEYIVEITKVGNDIKFNSIGELNSATGFIDLTIIETSPPFNASNATILNYQECPQETQGILVLIIAFALAGLVIFIGLKLSKFVGVIGGIILIGSSIYYLACSTPIGVLMIVAGVIIIIAFLMSKKRY